MGKVPVGILFKSAHTRGGFGENLRLHDFTMNGIPVVMRITMNWNPSYSYAEDSGRRQGQSAGYWKVLATPVPEEKGIAHFHDVQIWNIKATGATDRVRGGRLSRKRRWNASPRQPRHRGGKGRPYQRRAATGPSPIRRLTNLGAPIEVSRPAA